MTVIAVNRITHCIEIVNEVFNAFEQYGNVSQIISELVNKIKVVGAFLRFVERILDGDSNAVFPIEL